MVELLLLGLLAVFTIAGICEFVYLIRLMFYFPYVKTNSYSLVVLKEDYAVRQLNFLWQKLKWQGEDYASGIIAITDNLGYDELIDCSKFIVNKNIILSSIDSLTKDTYLPKTGVLEWKSPIQASKKK